MKNFAVAKQEIIKISLINFIGISLAILVPILSHITDIPFYYLEPMRLISILIYISFNKKNGLIYALYMPLLNTLVTGHPTFFKSVLIATELLINLYLIDFLSRKSKLAFTLQLFISIVLSKIYYYLLKLLLLNVSILQGELFSSDLTIQLVFIIINVIIIISLYRTFKFF
ncbi:MAG: hypothetical protein NZM09_03915, partial [Ignavibacterium sp.]|nr:hypothetical protein [Ignavibacterium sp.]MDW8374826.1 hypothetical protein [Ignavibacteriales bacterium]